MSKSGIDTRSGFRKPLEQQGKPQRIDVGDGERIGHQRTCTRTTARPHRNVVVLGPFDEVGHDEEVAGKFHVLDDVEFGLEPLPVVIMGIAFGQTNPLKAAFKPLFRLPAKLRRFGRECCIRILLTAAGEAWQDGRASFDNRRAALGNLNCVAKCFRHIGKQRGHLRAGFETIVDTQTWAAVVRHHRIGGDGHQRIMGLEIIRRRKEGLIGRHERHIRGIGQRDHLALVGPVVTLLALQFEIDAIFKHGLEAVEPLGSTIGMALANALIHRPLHRTGQGNQPVRALLQP